MSYRLLTGKPKADMMLVMIPFMFGTVMALVVMRTIAVDKALEEPAVELLLKYAPSCWPSDER